MEPKVQNGARSLRWLALAGGIGLIALAFAAATHVADTREGLIAEVVTLFAALAGISLVLYGIFGGARPAAPRASPPTPARASAPDVRSVRDLITGGAGLAVAVVLLSGLAASAGIQWAGLGIVLLLPMIAGSVYLCVRFIRAPLRSWKLELKKPRGPAQP